LTTIVKRTQKEKYDIILNGSEKAITAILPVLDDLERAIQNADKTEDVKKKKKKKKKKKNGKNKKKKKKKKKIEKKKKKKKKKKKNKKQTGYTLNDKVIRHAKVGSRPIVTV
jgi:molecular chaperone GrpE